MKVKLYRILAFCIISTRCFAGDVMQMSLKDTVDRVIRENLSLKSEKLLQDEKKLSRDTSWNFLYPEMSVSASASKNYSYIGATENRNSSTLSLSGSASWSLRASDFLDIFKSINDFQIGKLDYEIAKTEVKNKAVLYYYLLQVDREQIELQKMLQDNSRARLNNAKLGYRNSEVSRIELLRKEYNYKENSDRLTALENNYQILMIRFKQLLNIPDDVMLEFSDKLPEIEQLNIEHLKEAEAEKTISVFQLQLESEKVRLENKKNIFRFLPYLSMSFSAGTDAVAQERNWQDDSQQSIALRAAVTLPLNNILPFSSVQASILKGKKTLDRAKLAVEEEIQNQSTEKIAGLTAINQLLTSCESHKENCGITKEAYLLSERAYQEGELDYQTLSDTESDYREAVYNLQYVKYELLKSILDFGKRFNISLQQLGVIE